MKKQLVFFASALLVGVVWLRELNAAADAAWFLCGLVIAFACFVFMKQKQLAFVCALPALALFALMDSLIPASAFPAVSAMGLYCAAAEKKLPLKKDVWFLCLLGLQALTLAYEVYYIFVPLKATPFFKTSVEREDFYILLLMCVCAILGAASLKSVRRPAKGKTAQAGHAAVKSAVACFAMLAYFGVNALLCLKLQGFTRVLVFPMLLCMLVIAARPDPAVNALLREPDGETKTVKKETA